MVQGSGRDDDLEALGGRGLLCTLRGKKDVPIEL